MPVVSRVPRVSMGANQYQSFTLPIGGGGRRLTSIGETQPEKAGLTEKDIDERVSSAPFNNTDQIRSKGLTLLN